ncbi:MAG: signal peptidase I [Oscillospiraceae bacterium]|nr:signal peptidase I [Oscillospiraceae bacterium]
MKKTDIRNNKKAAAAGEKSTRGEIYEWIQCLVFALIFCVVMFVFLFRLVDVVGDSMNPTLEDGDKMVVSDLFYKPKQGDIIIFRKDEYKSRALVKRVIATEGQTVEIDFTKGRVYVDGELLDEPYIAEPTKNQIDFTGTQIVPEGCVFVMGDNRNESADSRDSRIGMIDERLIIGKVLLTVYPLNHMGSPYGD